MIPLLRQKKGRPPEFAPGVGRRRLRLVPDGEKVADHPEVRREVDARIRASILGMKLDASSVVAAAAWAERRGIGVAETVEHPSRCVSWRAKIIKSKNQPYPNNNCIKGNPGSYREHLGHSGDSGSRSVRIGEGPSPDHSGSRLE